MEVTNKKLKSTFSLKRVGIPIAIGIAFSIFSLAQSNFDFSLLQGLAVSWNYIFLAILFIVVRDLMYIIRLRILTENKLSWRDNWHVIMLWEFASSVSPSMVGGSAFALFFLNAEGIKLGKSTAIVLVTALLDELFYIISVLFILMIVGTKILTFSIALPFNPMLFFFIGYGFIILLTTIITLGVFVMPQGCKTILVKVTSLKFLKKWQDKAAKTGDEIITTSQELKGKTFMFWTKAFVTTALTWTARFLVLNCLILALNPDIPFSFIDQLGIYAKQLVMWVILLISPTPGASGVAELSFSAFFANDFPENMHAAVALVWRAISYYPYLIIGLIILPIWLRKLEKKRSEKQ